MINKIKEKYFILIISFVICTMFIVNFSVLADDQEYGNIEFITVASGAGDWELIGGKVADIITKEIPGITATSIPGGATVNISRIERGEAQIGLVHSFLPALAVKGKEPYQEIHEKLRMIISLWKGYAHAVVPKNSDIESISDLTKKPYDVWASKPGLGSQVLSLAIFNAFGFTPEDIRNAGGVVHEIGLSDGATMMKDRRMDYLMFPVVYPYSMLIDVNTAIGVKLLPIDGKQREDLIGLLPGLVEGTIPAGSYEGQSEDIPTVANFHQLACSSDLPDNLVYDITEAIVRNIPELRALSSSLKAISIENATEGMEVPLHPGAEKYYKENKQ